MSRANPPQDAAVSALGLRLAHALLFCALAAPVLRGGVPEWRHLAHALTHPFHAGAPPSALLLVVSLLAALGAPVLLLALARRRSAPPWASRAILGALCLVCLTGGATVQADRSEARANLALLELARRVHLTMVGRLQQEGEVPREEAAWAQALASATARHDRVRDRLFRSQPPRILRVHAPDALGGAPQVPGQLLLWVSGDGVTFELRVVGFGAQGPSLLRHPDGTPLVLKGLFNPELLQASGPGAPLPEGR